MPRSEIDDIFASKGKPPSAQPIASSSTAVPKKKKKDKKRKREHEGVEETPRKRGVPETVVDPSITVTAPKAPASKPTAKPKPAKKDRKDLSEFTDSRGSAPKRKTEEGFTIYKEAELGIDVEAGETPLCPFDCECCF